MVTLDANITAVILAFIALLGTIGSPLIVSYYNNKGTDKLAAIALAASKKASQDAAEAARLLLTTNTKASSERKSLSDKIDIIHTQTNSNLTVAKQAEFDSATRELASLRELTELRAATGGKPSEATAAAIIATEKALEGLSRELKDRKDQAKLVEKQIDVQKAAIDNGDAVPNVVIVKSIVTDQIVTNDADRQPP